MDHGMNGKCIHVLSNKRDIEQNTHQETRSMDDEHTRGTTFFFLKRGIVFIYLFVYIFYYVFNGCKVYLFCLLI